jgi:ADP-ribose pyrophosphatase YjhB (NUDIX family)
MSEETMRRVKVILDQAARRRLLEELGLDPITGRQPLPIDDDGRDAHTRHSHTQ